MSQHEKHLSAYLKSKRSGSKSSGAAKDRNAHTGKKPSTKQLGKSQPSADLKLKRGLDLTRIPEEVILKIFKYLSPSELLVCAQVCHKWSAVSQDSCLWEPLLPYLPKRVRDNLTFKETKEEGFDWKREVIKRCIHARNEEILRKRGVSPYTGLQKDAFHPLRFTDIRWKLCVTDTSGKEYWRSSDCSTLFQSSLCVRWYSLNLPPLSRLKTLQVFSFVPVFFNRSWKPHYESATTRSLVLQFDLRSKGSRMALSQAKAVSGAGMITAHVICSSVLAACWSASWKDGGELAFLTLCLHQHNLTKKVLLGSHCRTFIPSAHVPVPDDIDPKYGLHGYSATIELRNHKATFWGRQYRELYQQYLADSYVSLGGGSHEHGSFSRKLSLPWKTELFKNVLPDMCFLDVTVLHDRKPFWCFR
ncbi:F-box only protein 15 isoform X2 [Pocillopora verrucosa]|uniref:F-box only protein 15 isoform X2 n=1 Tax=Pocillopora verrucosa TaxID=203993 RepID=UPI0033428B20